MNIDNQKNGNNQLNSIRNEFNDRTKKKFFLGNSYNIWINIINKNLLSFL